MCRLYGDDETANEIISVNIDDDNDDDKKSAESPSLYSLAHGWSNHQSFCIQNLSVRL